MAGNVNLYTPGPSKSKYRDTIAMICAALKSKFPSAYSKACSGADDGEFIKRVAWQCRLQGITCYLNWKRGQAGNLSKDILNFENSTGAIDRSGLVSGVEHIDIFLGHGAPGMGFGWTDTTVFVDDNPGSPTQGQKIIATTACVVPAEMPGQSPVGPIDPSKPIPHNTLLGHSLFCAHALGRIDVLRLRKELDAYHIDMGCRFTRWFYTVGGDYFEGYDPWLFAGAFKSSPTHAIDAQRVVTEVTAAGMKSHLILMGSWAQGNTEAKRNLIVDDSAALINQASNRGHWELIEICNEPWMNWYPHGGTDAMLQQMATRLAGLLLDKTIRITLGAPSTVTLGASKADIQEQVKRMYANIPALTAFTFHRQRGGGISLPDFGPYAPMYKYDGEPDGPGASANGDISNPAILVGDYWQGIQAGLAGRVFHSDPGAWLDLLHPHFKETTTHGRYASVTLLPNWKQLAWAHKEASLGYQPGMMPHEGGGPGPGPQPPATLVPEQKLTPGQMLVSPNGQWRCIYQTDANLVIYDEDGAATWASHTETNPENKRQAGRAEIVEGKFTLFDAKGDAYWRMDHAPLEAMSVQLNDDGNLVAYGALWASAAHP